MGREPQKSSRRKKGGKGTHGSTTKAGKVRMQTPKIPPSVKHSKKSFPRYRNRRNYEELFMANLVANIRKDDNERYNGSLVWNSI